MTVALGTLSALTAPLVMSLGFVLWDNHWKGSALGLNFLKCNVASLGFLILTLSTGGFHDTDHQNRNNDNSTINNSINGNNNSHDITNNINDITNNESLGQVAGYLILSAVIGILIGDYAWLQSLQWLGARRVILMDSIKPFFAAFLGYIILDEQLRWAALGGMVITIAGVLLVSLETSSPHMEANNQDKEEEDEVEDVNETQKDVNQTTQESQTPTNEIDATQQEVELTTSNNNSNNNNNSSSSSTTGTNPHDFPTLEEKSTTENKPFLTLGYIYSILNVLLDTYGAVLIKQHASHLSVWAINLIRFGSAGAIMIIMLIFALARDSLPHKQQQKQQQQLRNSDVSQRAWYHLPVMERHDWIRVGGGIVLVTFLTPAMSNYALLKIALALTLTFTSIGPLYALPLSYWLQGQAITPRAMCGSALAVIGIVVLAVWGSLKDENDNNNNIPVP